jgi:hypothetical protein
MNHEAQAVMRHEAQLVDVLSLSCIPTCHCPGSPGGVASHRQRMMIARFTMRTRAGTNAALRHKINRGCTSDSQSARVRRSFTPLRAAALKLSFALGIKTRPDRVS